MSVMDASIVGAAAGLILLVNWYFLFRKRAAAASVSPSIGRKTTRVQKRS